MALAQLAGQGRWSGQLTHAAAAAACTAHCTRAGAAKTEVSRGRWAWYSLAPFAAVCPAAMGSHFWTTREGEVVHLRFDQAFIYADGFG